MFNKSFWIGITVGVICVTLIGRDVYKRLHSAPDSLSTQSNEIEPTTSYDQDSIIMPLSSSIGVASQASIKPTPKPTAKPTAKPVVPSTPTPTPKPLVDYYVQAHSQTLIPEQTNATEYIETQTISRQRLEVDFGVNNASVGDTVTLRIYEDGNVRKEETRTISSTNNFHLAEVYYPMQYAPGTHTVRLVLNENHAVPESNYGNNEYAFTYKIIAETTPPTFTIRGPEIINGQTCFTWENLQDNKSVYTDVWAKWKIDGGSWSSQATGTTWGCISGTPGSSHTYYVHAEDFRGNIREDSRVFTLY